jgi:hypothetical protein
MLVARRDPPFTSGAHEASHPLATHGMHAAPSQPRFMTALQVIGSVLAIPVGLASGYSIYHANFSDAARCQGLRANIVSMLDKSADASTLRLLVRRDVVAFEQSCGAVDPDAVAAFKTLLAAPARQAAHMPARPHSETAKAAPVQPATAVATAKPLHHDNYSDVNWLAAVRQALVHQPALPSVAATPSMPSSGAMPPHPLGELIVPVATPTSVGAAPALPPAASVAAAPVPASADAHPVPPGSIPDPAPLPRMASAGRSGWGFYGLIAKIPVIGHVVRR